MNWAKKLTQSSEKENDLKVWHIPQIPGTAFEVSVKSLEEGKRILDVLSYYDLFQYEQHIKPDYSNAGGLVVLTDGEWIDWCDEDGNTIDELELDEHGELKLYE